MRLLESRNRVIPAWSGCLLPGPHRLGGGVDSIGHQGVVQIGQQEANSPGPQPGQINGVDAFKIKIRDQRKFHGITF